MFLFLFLLYLNFRITTIFLSTFYFTLLLLLVLILKPRVVLSSMTVPVLASLFGPVMNLLWPLRLHSLSGQDIAAIKGRVHIIWIQQKFITVILGVLSRLYHFIVHFDVLLHANLTGVLRQIRCNSLTVLVSSPVMPLHMVPLPA